MVKENVIYSDGFIEIWFHFPRHFNGNKRQYMRNYFLQIEENYKFFEKFQHMIINKHTSRPSKKIVLL